MSKVEVAPMISNVWGDLAPIVAAIIVERPHLGSRLALSNRRTIHSLAAFISHSIADGRCIFDIAREVDERDIRELLLDAIPDAHPRLHGILDRLGDRAMPFGFYFRLNQLLHSAASD